MANPALPPKPSTDPVVSTPALDILPSPPFVTVSGVPNFRAIGGYKSVLYPSLRVRNDLIYRSALPSHITPEGIETLIKKLNVDSIFDLRSEVEIMRMSKNSAMAPIPGITRFEVPAFPNSEWTEEHHMRTAWLQYTDPIDPTLGYSKGFLDGYKRIASVGAPAYAKIFRHLISNNTPKENDANGGAIVVHCTAGKDRTGVFCGLVLKLCGVDDDDIAHEYSLTQHGLGEWREIIIQKLLNDAKYGADAAEEAGKEERREQANRMMGSRKENMKAFLGWIEEEHKGVEGYLTNGVGLSSEEIQALRSLMLVKDE